MKKQTPTNHYLYDTQVENLFISEYMASAPGDYVKVYLLALMCAEMDQPIDDEALAGQLGITPAALADAWDYWEEQGLISRSADGLIFENLKEKAFGRAAKAPAPRASAALDDDALKLLYHRIEKATGRLLDGRELEAIAGWISDYKINPDLIEYCYDYCTKAGKSNKYNYVQAILSDWKAKGISDLQELKAHMDENDRYQSMFRSIFRELGFSRNPSAEERRIMGSWFDDLNCTMDEVLDACKATAGTSNPNIKYVNAVIRGRKSPAPASGYSAAAAVEAEYERIRQENEAREAAIRAEIFSKLPGLQDITNKLAENAFNLSSAMLQGNTRRLAEIRAAAEALTQERDEMLTGAGYSPDALEHIYNCSECKDTGELPDGGKCRCYAEKLEAAMRLQEKL